MISLGASSEGILLKIGLLLKSNYQSKSAQQFFGVCFLFITLLKFAYTGYSTADSENPKSG